MRTPAQLYYTSLEPFRELFGAGTPMLMYHKLGSRPGRVRIKGLYVGNRLFERQLRQLAEAGYSTPPYGTSPAATGNLQKHIHLTFDDGFTNVLKHGLKPLEKHGFRAIQFLVADLIGGHNEWEVQQGEVREKLMSAAQVKEWLAAGHEIGSHTLTHPFLARIEPARAREEIFASRKKLEDLFGRPVRHFCYPYGDWNPAVRDMVEEAGYETACTTAFGVNNASTPKFGLKRLMARHQSLSFKSLKARLAHLAGG
jgi:peptidoglycan/xylan/chitin deacetylase (PgdA/CDA1 family)